ncbi:hypothetical protein [Arthrobacter cheniae]|nr:hypothetical protein [Arthrobacter cheniae]
MGQHAKVIPRLVGEEVEVLGIYEHLAVLFVVIIAYLGALVP